MNGKMEDVGAEVGLWRYVSFLLDLKVEKGGRERGLCKDTHRRSGEIGPVIGA